MFKIAIIIAVGLATAFAFPSSGLESSGLESSGVLTISDIDASGIQIDSSGLQIADLDISGIETSGMESTDIQASGVSVTESSGIEIDQVTIDQIELAREKRSTSTEESSGYETSGTESSGTETAELNDYSGMRFRREAESSGQETTTVVDAEGSGSGVATAGSGIATAGSGIAPEASGVAPAKCEAMASCTAHNDCNGGQCLGVFVGTCNCLPCISFLGCKSDADCGNLKNGCNKSNGLCDCFAAHIENGFKDTTDALLNFCNVQHCTAANASSTCFGLPCSAGNCFC